MTFKINKCYLVTASAWAGRIVALGTNFFNICVLLNFLGTENYAIAAVVLSLKGWFSLADFGLGISLQNYLSESRAQDTDTKDLLKTTFQICMITLVILIGLAWIFSNTFESFFIKSNTSSEQNICLLVSVSLIFFSIGSVVYKAFYALQKGYIAHILQMIADMLGAIGVFFITKHYGGENKLFFSLLPLTVFPASVAFLAFLSVFLKRCSFKQICSSLSLFWLKKVLHRGISFWVFNLMVASVLYVDYLVASHTLSSEDIVHYNILEKGFTAIFFGYASFLTALHPQCTELFVNGMTDQMNTIIRKTCTIGCLIFPLLCIAFMLIFSYVSPFFFTEKIIFESSTLLLVSLYMMLRVITDTYSTAILSMSKLKSLYVFIPMQALVNLIMQYYCSLHFGLNGIYLGLIASFIFTVAWGLPLQYYRLSKKHNAYAT